MVFQIGFGHFDCRCRRRVERRTGFQQANDFGTAITGPLNDRVQLILCGPAHFHQIRQWDTRNGGIARQRHHCIAVAAQNEGSDVFHGDVEFSREEVTEACRIKHTGHAANLVVRQTGEFAQRPNHRVQRVGDADNECVWRVGSNAFANGFHDLQVDSQQVITAHTGLTRNTGSHDAYVCASDFRVVVRAGHGRVEFGGWARFCDIEGLTLRDTFGDVEQDNVAQFLDCCEMGKRAPDLPCADKRDLGSGHVVYSDRVTFRFGIPK